MAEFDKDYYWKTRGKQKLKYANDRLAEAQEILKTLKMDKKVKEIIDIRQKVVDLERNIK